MTRPAAIVLGGSALLVVFVLADVLGPGTSRLPGIDSGNIYAWEVYTRSVLAEWRLPHWNPYHFAGTPHLADPQTTVLYPPAMLLRWLLPAPAFLGWMMALHLWLAGAGTLFAARALGLGWVASAAAAAAVTLGGSVPGWIHDGHLLVIYSAAWAPWALGLAVVSVRSGRVAPDGRLVAVLVLQFLTGYLQGSVYLGAALALYFGYSALWPEPGVRRLAPLAQLVLLVALSAAAAAFQLLPTATLVAASGRGAGLSYNEALEGSWQVRDLATLLFPFHGIDYERPYRLLADRLAYVGWVLTAFVPFAFFGRGRLRMALFLGVLAAAAGVLALGDDGGLFRLHHAALPGLRVPGRVLFLATIALALLGALGLDAFVSLARERRWTRLALPAAAAGAAAAAAVYVVAVAAPQAPPPAHGWPWLPLAMAGTVVAVAGMALSGWRRTALAAALAAVVVDVTTLSAGAVFTTPVDTEASIRAWIGPPTGGRALTLCENRIGAREFLQNREPTLDGLPSLHLRDYADWAFLARSGEVPPGGGMYRRIGSEGERPARRDLIDMANVTRIVACEHAPGGRLAGLALQRNDRAWPRAVWACAAEEVTRREAIVRVIRGRYDASGRLQPRHYIRLRWVPGLGEARRRELERAHRLEDGVVVEGVTWRYLLGDASLDAVLAIMRDPEVEDTGGVDRGTGAFTPTADLQESIPEIPGDEGGRMLLPTAEACAVRADVDVVAADRFDGRVTARVQAPADGVLFFSEPYYAERRATVDGRDVPIARANLAFIAVPVPAGEHEVELRYRPASFHLGAAVSGATALGYAVAAGRRRRRRPPT